jgi:hypothetical protein
MEIFEISMSEVGFLLFTLILERGFISNSFGYIDPGSGSLVIQMIVGALVGFGIAIKVYWYKFKEKIFGINKKND